MTQSDNQAFKQAVKNNPRDSASTANHARTEKYTLNNPSTPNRPTPPSISAHTPHADYANLLYTHLQPRPVCIYLNRTSTNTPIRPPTHPNSTNPSLTLPPTDTLPEKRQILGLIHGPKHTQSAKPTYPDIPIPTSISARLRVQRVTRRERIPPFVFRAVV